MFYRNTRLFIYGFDTDTSTRNTLSLVLVAAVVSVRNQLRWVSHTVAAFATLTHFVCGCGSLLATLTHFVCGYGSLLATLTHFVCGCGSLLATLTHFVRGCGSLLATLTYFVCGCGSLLAQAHPSLTFGFANHRRLRMVAGWRYLYF